MGVRKYVRDARGRFSRFRGRKRESYQVAYRSTGDRRTARSARRIQGRYDRGRVMMIADGNGRMIEYKVPRNRRSRARAHNRAEGQVVAHAWGRNHAISSRGGTDKAAVRDATKRSRRRKR